MTFMLFLVKLELVGLLTTEQRVKATKHALALNLWSYDVLDSRLLKMSRLYAMNTLCE